MAIAAIASRINLGLMLGLGMAQVKARDKEGKDQKSFHNVTSRLGFNLSSHIIWCQ